jgi:type 1 glutamine amidotransferase
MLRILLVGMLACLVSVAVGTSASAQEKAAKTEKARVLFLTQSNGFVHDAVNRWGEPQKLSTAEVSMTQLGQQTGLFTVECIQNAAELTKENLEKYDILMLYTTGELPISDEAREYLTNVWLKQKGKGVIGFHSATDTFNNDNPKHAWYRELIGGTFNGHPWNWNAKVTISVHDPEHPTMKVFGQEFQTQDEIYQYKNFVPENVRVLMSLNMAKTEISKPYHVPVAWCRMWGEGKIYYNNLGHNEQTWADKRFLKSTEAAVRWVLNQVEGDATPNPEVSKEQEALAKKAVEGK